MPLHSLRFVVGLALAGAAGAAENDPASTTAAVSPLRQYLRESAKAQAPTKTASTAPNPASITADSPVVLPAFHVKERSAVQTFDRVQAIHDQEDRLSLHPQFKTKTDSLEVLQRPTLEPSRDGTPRLKLNIFQFRW